MKLSFHSFTALVLLPTMAGAVTQNEMDTLVDAFCATAVNISNAFWQNGGKHHDEADPYPAEACKAAYDVAAGNLKAAYDYPDPVLFKPTLSTGSNTFRPTFEGALSYFIGTECVLSAAPEDVFPPGNTDGSTFKEYGFGLANYDKHDDGTKYAGFADCTWEGNSYAMSDTMGVAQGKVIFHRTEGRTTTVDKTFSFEPRDGAAINGVVITGHHSSQEIPECTSTQFVPSPVGCTSKGLFSEDHDEHGHDDGQNEGVADSPGTTRKLAGYISAAIPAFFLGGMVN